MDFLDVSVYDSTLKLVPLHHQSMGNFTDIYKDDDPEIQYVPMEISDAELGKAVRKGFTFCTGSPQRK